MQTKKRPLKQTFVILIGNIASGKTTAMQLLAKKLKLKTVDADSLFQTTDPFREDYLKNIKRWALANELWLTVERAKILQTIPNKERLKQPVIIDSGLLMSWVYAYSHFLAGNINRAEWDLYEEIYSRLTANFSFKLKVVYFTYPIKTLLKRIQNRNRDFEIKYYTAAYLKQIDTGLQAFYKKLKKQKVPVLLLSEEKVGNFINNQQQMQRFLKTIINFINK